MKNEEIEILVQAFEKMGKKITRWMAGPLMLEAYFTSTNGNTIVINADGITEVKGKYGKEFECDESEFVGSIEV